VANIFAMYDFCRRWHRQSLGIQSDVVVTDELKDAIVAMMMRKEEIEEQMKYVL